MPCGVCAWSRLCLNFFVPTTGMASHLPYIFVAIRHANLTIFKCRRRSWRLNRNVQLQALIVSLWKLNSPLSRDRFLETPMIYVLSRL
ncbi:hypothetical protein B0T10DRAFT_498512 [Thelonectria olida]|uniref:Secreted protein n=1 Tax=Thelonectria olida TaxID=1576542 RepID=A0A9P9AJV0_9HYPO|nr:hypothetical protein B0T10DRAFT_498512 [Thelonectria olida]